MDVNKYILRNAKITLFVLKKANQIFNGKINKKNLGCWIFFTRNKQNCLQLRTFYLNLLTGNVELRIAAGEAVVVLYEAAYDHDEEEIVDLVEPLIPGLQVIFKIHVICKIIRNQCKKIRDSG